jgi:hypothetical protein
MVKNYLYHQHFREVSAKGACCGLAASAASWAGDTDKQLVGLLCGLRYDVATSTYPVLSPGQHRTGP